MSTQYMLLDERNFDFDYIDACSNTYEVQPELVALPEGVKLQAQITKNDLQEGLKNARPVFL